MRHLSNGNLAVAMPNLGSSAAPISICLSSLGWKHGNQAHAKDVWKQRDLPADSFTDGKFTATVAAHDTLLLLLSPAATAE